jgi:hypothetical protein
MSQPPQPLLSPQELARWNNENEAVYSAFERRLAQLKKRTKAAVDRAWREAEREARPVRAVGFFLPR